MSSYVSHVSEDGSRREPIEVHLREVADMAAEFARPFEAEAWAYAAGIAHDIGKYSTEFQNRILHNGPKVDHSTAGAFELSKNPMAWPLSYCVAGHHGGLPDGGVREDDGVTLFGRLRKAEEGDIPSYSSFAESVEIPVVTGLPSVLSSHKQSAGQEKGARDLQFSAAFFTRMIFSCLVDADFLCTERFMKGAGRSELSAKSISELCDMLENRLESFYPPETDLNKIRCGILDDCLRAATGRAGVYSLTVPTGGGKTLAAMRFALQHSLRSNGKTRRVIIAEPYTSIIEQNADVYRDIFGKENVLEHHMNFDFDEKEESDSCSDADLVSRLKLATENWDVPIVVTTNVQLFESLHSNKTSRCRKLHNIVGSVIVLDEAQMIPAPFLAPCVKVLAELVKYYHCSVVLCSATQPALERFFEEEGLSVSEIATSAKGLFDAMRRVTYRTIGAINDHDLAERLSECEQVLCIVNSRKQARSLYERMANEVDGNQDDRGIYHLSTLMYPDHRRRVIEKIRMRAKSSGGSCEACRVVSTSLVEAGVDLDFPVVYRALAGIDSIVQAGGRCNREGKRGLDDSKVYVFCPAEAYAIPPEVKQRASITQGFLAEASEYVGLVKDGDAEFDFGLPETIRSFFDRLYFFKGANGSGGVNGLDREGILELLCRYTASKKGVFIQFAEVARKFQLIDQGSCPVIIPAPEIMDELRALKEGYISRISLRKLTRFSVSVYDHDVKALLGAGAIEAVSEGVYVLVDKKRYHEDTGLDLEVQGGEGICW